ncbi:DNA binding protein [Salinarchaeum sp. Harcht-Bsk1]|uniref:helix-turn-helix domain-containing protein n=1 Tax=Salinarchaeum sp. Harcht-Bsk1 TaxID=1333523 RepID=UPI00034245E9|nr:helix-turn-helix domain-containing protein [Salinarchaeum sp. Harcht-Bsk1]AGN02127.1 DNA binding protein [Salinarchaeum sp. Harcht-Bsk1]
MTATADSTSAEPLRARLRVEPHEAAGCAVLDAGDRGEDVVWTDCRSADDDGTCRAAVTVEVGDRRTREFVEGSVGEYCVCHAFREVECAADIERFCDGALVVSVTVPRRGALRDLVAALRDREASVHLEQVLPLAGEDGGRQLCLDAAAVTEKQREAIATAVDLGYYERPRSADLDAVAEALDVSRSAASQRLNAAETTLIHALVETTDIERVENDASAEAVTGAAAEEPVAE